MADRIETATTQTTNAIAVAGVTSAAWLPSLKSASEVAGMLMPIFGVIWLVVQIVRALAGPAKPPKA